MLQAKHKIAILLIHIFESCLCRASFDPTHLQKQRKLKRRQSRKFRLEDKVKNRLSNPPNLNSWNGICELVNEDESEDQVCLQKTCPNIEVSEKFVKPLGVKTKPTKQQ